MYYCELESSRSIKDFALHFKSCCCSHAHMWYYYMADQHDHIKRYYEYLGLIEVFWDDFIGLSLYYPRGIRDILIVSWPYNEKKKDIPCQAKTTETNIY